MERIFEVLDEYQIKYTFPVTAQVCLEDPDNIKKIIYHGDEIAGHGDIHKAFRSQSYGEQRKRMEKMIRIIREVSGIRINGFRAPKLRGDIISSKVADELGLSYDSSTWINEKWWVNIKGKFIKIKRRKMRRALIDVMKVTRATRPLQLLTHFFIKRAGDFSEREDRGCSLPFNPIFGGQELEILEIPVSSIDDDTLIDKAKIKDWKKVAKIWETIFDDHYINNDLYVLLAHPDIIGRKENIKALRSFVEHAMNKNDVWFATLSELATWWKQSFRHAKEDER